MISVKLQDKRIVVGGKHLPLISGEVHYWRLNPDCWEKIIDRVKELGLEIIATYVPWEYHETAKGKLDFGKLVRFIELAKKKNVWLIIRPGPYLYTEWVNKGVPDYMVKYHRNHPEFKKKSEVYIKKICSVIRPFLATAGGNIIMVQADNEVDIWSRWYEKDMGFLDVPGEFQKFLKNKYKNIKELNRCCGTRYKSFDEAKPVTEDVIDDFFYKRRYLDFCEFRHYYGVEVAKWAVESYRKQKINVPICLNAYPCVDIQHWRKFQDIADVFGIDLYPVKEFNWLTEQRGTMDSVRYARTFAGIPYIAEFECGVWQGNHYTLGILTANHYRLICLSVLQAGIAGWNWYMLVNRDNWYMCPINEWGRKRNELYPVFKEIVSLYRRVSPAECNKLTDTAVSFDVLQTAAYMPYCSDNPVLNSLYGADIEYEFFDVDTGKINKKILFYNNKQFFSEQAQKRLLDYVVAGGNLVVFRDFPRLDENFRPLNVLGIKEPDKILESHDVKIHLGKEECFLRSPLFVYNNVPAEKIVAEHSSSVPAEQSLEEENKFDLLMAGQKYTVGYVQKKGKGRIIVIGVKPCPGLMIAIHKHLGVDIPSRSLLPGVTSSLLYRSGTYFLVVTNNCNEDKYAKIRLSKSLSGDTATDLSTGEKIIIETPAEITVYVPRKNGTVVEIKTGNNGKIKKNN